MLTKTQAKIMQVFAAKITEQFSIRGIARILKKDNSLIHRNIKSLIDKNLIALTKNKYLMLNYKQNHQELAYSEFLRSKEFIRHPLNKAFALFLEDVLTNMKDEYFIMLIFGSAVEKKNPRDIDIFFIVESNEKVNSREKALENISSHYSLKLDINVVSVESIYEMAAKRDQKNIFNESLNKHLILFGAENFYRLIKNARQ